MIKVTMFPFSSKGADLFNELSSNVEKNGYKISYIYNDIATARMTLDTKNKIFTIEINRHYSDDQKEIAILHELLHTKQIISGMSAQSFKCEIGFEIFEELYNAIQSYVLDAPIHKQLTEFGYDLTLITKSAYDELLEFYSKPNIKPMLIQHKSFPLYAAELYFAYSVDAYNELMEIIIAKDKEEYDNISAINLLLREFVNGDITFSTCFQSIKNIILK